MALCRLSCSSWANHQLPAPRCRRWHATEYSIRRSRVTLDAARPNGGQTNWLKTLGAAQWKKGSATAVLGNF